LKTTRKREEEERGGRERRKREEEERGGRERRKREEDETCNAPSVQVQETHTRSLLTHTRSLLTHTRSLLTHTRPAYRYRMQFSVKERIAHAITND